jgi:hypothetical protein
MDASAHVAEVGQQPHVVLTLLPKNTNVVLADTPGVTHKMLVRGNEKEGIVERLKEWLANKNRDFREREGDMGGGQRGS